MFWWQKEGFFVCSCVLFDHGRVELKLHIWTLKSKWLSYFEIIYNRSNKHQNWTKSQTRHIKTLPDSLFSVIKISMREKQDYKYEQRQSKRSCLCAVVSPAVVTECCCLKHCWFAHLEISYMIPLNGGKWNGADLFNYSVTV